MDLSKYFANVQGVIGKSSFTTMLSGLDLTITQEWVAEEHFMYGSSRLGVYRSNKTLTKQTFEVTEISNEGVITGRTVIDSFVYTLRTDSFTRVLTQKNYELSNHLGNVLAVVSDRRTPTSSGGINIDYYEADVTSATLFYPFGMEMKTYSADSNGYRFGMNTQEKDDEIFIGAYSAEYWEYDSRIGRRWNVDPMTGKYPWQSPYACFNNNPLQFSDPNGLEGQSDPPKQHMVKKDETLGGIAAANNVSVDDLLAWNKDNIAVKSANVVWAGYNINISDPNPTSDVSINVIDTEMKDRINFKPDVYFKGVGEKGNQFGYMTEIPGNQTGKEEYLERYFEFITGDGWTNMVYGPSSQMTQGVSQMESVDKARQYFYTKYAGNNGNFSSSNSVTNYKGTWAPSDVVSTGSGNMSAQFVGSCAINVFVSADCKNLIFVVANSTSQWSYSYHLLPKSWNPERPSTFTAYDSKEKISYSTIYNLYIWKEPITTSSSGSCTQNNSGGGCILR